MSECSKIWNVKRKKEVICLKVLLSACNGEIIEKLFSILNKKKAKIIMHSAKDLLFLIASRVNNIKIGKYTLAG